MPASGGLDYLSTPEFMYRLFGRGGFLAQTAQTTAEGGTTRPFGQAFRPTNPIPVNSSSSSTTTTRSNIAGINRPAFRATSDAPTTKGRFSGTGHVLGGE